jgi:uncharacterized LabA/DUF88 family protein
MSRVVALIDGFNLYHSIVESNQRELDAGQPATFYRFKWLDLRKMARLFVAQTDTLVGVYYFTALATWRVGKVDKHKKFIRANPEVTVVYGKFKERGKTCPICHSGFSTHEEKRTDVNIATRLVELAVRNEYDTAIVFSGDTDLIPAIECTKRLFPSKRLGVIFPPLRKNREFSGVVDFEDEVRGRHLRKSRLPDQVTLSDGTTITCPPEWM